MKASLVPDRSDGGATSFVYGEGAYPNPSFCKRDQWKICPFLMMLLMMRHRVRCGRPPGSPSLHGVLEFGLRHGRPCRYSLPTSILVQLPLRATPGTLVRSEAARRGEGRRPMMDWRSGSRHSGLGPCRRCERSRGEDVRPGPHCFADACLGRNRGLTTLGKILERSVSRPSASYLFTRITGPHPFGRSTE